jgi:hypothetical protein
VRDRNPSEIGRYATAYRFGYDQGACASLRDAMGRIEDMVSLAVLGELLAEYEHGVTEDNE